VGGRAARQWINDTVLPLRDIGSTGRAASLKKKLQRLQLRCNPNNGEG